jgi:hypothetical protein
MESLEYLLEILEASLKKNGDIPITTKHLVNIIKMAQRNMEKDELQADMIGPDED